MRTLSAAACLALLLLAGCNASDPDPVPPSTPTPAAIVPPEDSYDWSGVVDPDHELHSIGDIHTAGHGVSLIGHVGVQDILPLGVRGSITQVDVQGDLAVVSGMEGGMAFVLVDIKDPTDPHAVGWFPSAADGWTARFSDDGKYVFYGCQMLGETGYVLTNVVGTCRDPEAIHLPTDDNPGGVIAVDVSDPTNPTYVDFIETPGSHNIQVASIGDTDYIFTSAVTILKFDRTAGKLSQVAERQGVHDASVARHPVTGDWLMFTGTGELTIDNINDPTNPVPVFEGTSNDGWIGWHEQTMIPGLVDGKVILVLAGESFLQTGSGEGSLPDRISFVDITDPATPRLMGTWVPPFAPQLPWVGYLFSAHEIAATPTGQVAIAWYHGGVWVVDVSTAERQAAPLTVAAYQPHGAMNVLPATFAQTPLPYVPFVWGAGWTAEGDLVVPDMHTGVYVLKPDWGEHPAVDGGQ